MGAIDGTHINCAPSIEERQTSHNWKGGTIQNVLACCSFDLKFQYFLSGADGASSDAMFFIDAPPIYLYRLASITLPMQGSLPAIHL
jgi:hypothetical protein